MNKPKFRHEDLMMLKNIDKRLDLENEYILAKSNGDKTLKFDGIEYTVKYVEDLLDVENDTDSN
jgi:hypothetical protein